MNIFNFKDEANKNVQDETVVQPTTTTTPPATPIIDPAGAFSIIGSIASEEIALSVIIQREAEKLTALTATGNLTFANFTALAQSVNSTMKTVLLKNTILEAKLTETLDFIDSEFSPSIFTSSFIDNIISIIGSIANEEIALGTSLSNIGTIAEAFALPAVGLTIAQLQAVDQWVLSLIRVITEKNLVLLSKLRRLVRFLANNAITPSDSQAVQAAININRLIDSIRNEENGLARIIDGETAKLNRAVTVTLAAGAGGINNLLSFNDTVTSVIDVVVQKNMILEAKLEEILALLSLGNAAARLPFVTALSRVQQSIANEETSLAGLILAEAGKINAVRTLTPNSIPNLVAANDSASILLESIALKNMVLQQKNLEIINFILAL